MITTEIYMSKILIKKHIWPFKFLANAYANYMVKNIKTKYSSNIDYIVTMTKHGKIIFYRSINTITN